MKILICDDSPGLSDQERESLLKSFEVIAPGVGFVRRESVTKIVALSDIHHDDVYLSDVGKKSKGEKRRARSERRRQWGLHG